MKTVIRTAGKDFEKPNVEAGGKHEDDLWSGDLPLVRTRIVIPGKDAEFSRNGVHARTGLARLRDNVSRHGAEAKTTDRPLMVVFR